jgi:outer membrane receptor protein involved in Fe transport
MTTYENFGLKQKPLLPANRAFMSLDYEARKGWKFSYTVQWIGSKRLFVADLHHSYGSKESEPYFQMNAQVTKSFNEKLDVYLGGENLTNFMQHGDIINASQPYSADFDASQIWGPVMGINAYLGIRYKFK